MSDDTAQLIDEEVRHIVDRNYERSKQILAENFEKLHLMAEALIRFETLDSDQIGDIMEGRPARVPQNWDDDDRGSPNAVQTPPEGSASSGPDAPIGGPASSH